MNIKQSLTVYFDRLMMTFDRLQNFQQFEQNIIFLFLQNLHKNICFLNLFVCIEQKTIKYLQ